MREALRSPTARLREWAWQPLPYHAVLPARTLVRVTGRALLEDARPTRWSSVLKLFVPAALVAGAGGRREVLAYRSSLLAALPGPLRAPRVLGLDDGDDGSVWLWLEDVGDVYGRPLAAGPVRPGGPPSGGLQRGLPGRARAADRTVAERLAGAPPPGADPGPEDAAALARLGQQAAVQRLFGTPVGPRAAQVVRDQAGFVRLLTALPQTLCHHQSSLANLFAVRRPGRPGGDGRRRLGAGRFRPDRGGHRHPRVRHPAAVRVRRRAGGAAGPGRLRRVPRRPARRRLGGPQRPRAAGVPRRPWRSAGASSPARSASCSRARRPCSTRRTAGPCRRRRPSGNGSG